MMAGADYGAVVIDLETTGLGHNARPPRKDGVVQIGLAWRCDHELMSWEEVCYPGARYLVGGRADGALRINGLTPDVIEAALPAKAVAAHLRAILLWLAPPGGHVIIHSYNTQFDRPFVRRRPWALDAFPWGPCLMLRAAKRLEPSGRWLGLDRACGLAGVQRQLGEAHTAAGDAAAAYRLAETIGAPWLAPG